MKFSFLEIYQKFKQNKEKIIKFGLNGTLVVLILLVGSMFLAFTNRIFISPPVDSNLEENVEKLTNQEVIQVSILNSTSINGLANKAKTFLQLRNFDVVEVGNYSTPLPVTKVIDRVGDYASAVKVAKAIGVPDSLVTTQIDSTLFVRTTIVIGQDYPKLLPF
ncbi:MAG: LytR C-terminal domain-containing protein [Candidatus Kapaibacteriota bacterium]